MSKFGVGVGDDFPVDDGSGNAGAAGQGPKSEQEEFEAWKQRRDAYRAERAEWQRRREDHQAQREEWRQRKHEFKERVRQAARETFGDRFEEQYDRAGWGRGFRGRHDHRSYGFWPLLPIIGIVVFVSLIAAIIKSPFIFLALALTGVMFFMFRHHGHYHHHHRGEFRGRRRGRGDYDFDLKPSGGPQQSPQSGDAIVPPPPSAPESGK
ncbi:MAG TPA: hypothetical protein VGM36_12340 [Rhizomicrobium sp.]